MKTLMKSKQLLALLLVFVLVLSGCGGSSDEETKDTASNESNNGSQTADNNDSTGSDAEEAVDVDPLGKYVEPITVTSFFEIAPPIANGFTEDGIKTNIWAEKLLEELNIDLQYEWFAMQSDDDSVQKKNIAIASGELPDFMMVNKEQLALLAKSDLINKDIGSIYDQYASDHLKEWMNQEGTAALDSATYDGQLIAIPSRDSSIDTSPFLWLRQDWLDNLGLEVPTTMDELFDVMTAFKENDPDGNGQDDTIGIIMNNTFLDNASGDMVGLFNGFGAYPKAWLEDGGNLVYGSIQPEMKEALAFLNKMYEAGLIEEDFAVKDSFKVAELPAAGTAGMQYGAMWNAMWPLQSSLDNDNNANWVAVAIPSATGKPAQPQIRLNILGYYVVSKDAENPEALIKMLNFFVEKFSFIGEEEYAQYLTDATGASSFDLHGTMFKTYNALKNLEAYWHVNEALDSGDKSALNAEELNYINSIEKYMNEGDLASAGGFKTFGPGGSFSVMDYYYDDNLFMMDQFYGAPTKTMKQKMQLINDKEIEYFTKIIMGSESIDAFDDFVAEVNKIGLEDITAEVNEWHNR